MSENMSAEVIENEQSYIRLIRYLRKQQEGKSDETSNAEEADSCQSE